MQEYHWTPQQVGQLTLGQLVTLWNPDLKPKYLSKAEQLALLNARRAKQGLPPVEAREGQELRQLNKRGLK